MLAHDEEGAQDIGRVIQPQTIKPEKQRIQRSQRSQAGTAFFNVPYAGLYMSNQMMPAAASSA